MDLRTRYPAVVKLHPELRNMKADEALYFILGEIEAALRKPGASETQKRLGQA
jgi:hypothetical protein